MLYLDYGRKEGEWIPNQFGGHENIGAVTLLKDLNVLVHRDFPGAMTIAEESTSWAGVSRPTYAGGLGFTFKWNMGWMHDMLEYFSKEPVHRVYHHRNLTFVLLYAFTERFMLPLSHDEVVHGKASLLSKMPGDPWQKFANLRSLLGLMMTFPGKKLLFMGADFGQWDEWDHDHSLDWHLLQYDPHKGIQKLMQDLLRVYRDEPALHEVDFHNEGFDWVDFQDSASSVIAFDRLSRDRRSVLTVACNFTPVPREGYRIGVRDGGTYAEVLNTDSSIYGGGNAGNAGRVQAEAIPCHGRPFSVTVTLPPLGIVVFRRQ
jgi:1,4-alpha-glucan branching enzyme